MHDQPAGPQDALRARISAIGSDRCSITSHSVTTSKDSSGNPGRRQRAVYDVQSILARLLRRPLGRLMPKPPSRAGPRFQKNPNIAPHVQQLAPGRLPRDLSSGPQVILERQHRALALLQIERVFYRRVSYPSIRNRPSVDWK